jgi:peptidoglycan/xylan/chitin deacetylase (PgdA/CDA1 family)
VKPLSSFETALFRAAGTLTSSVGRGGRGLLVLIYHRVLEAPDPMRSRTVQAPEFAAHMDLVASCFNVLPLSEALGRLKSRSLPSRALSVTFDDGYADNLTVAAPIMRERGVSATVFVATGYLDGGVMFNDAITESMRNAPSRFDLSDLGLGVLELGNDLARRAAIARLIGEIKYRPAVDRRSLAMEILGRAGAEPPRHLMMTSAQVRELRDGGVEIGAHTATHPILARLEPTEARDDIARSRQMLEELLGDPVRLFAYPNGRPGEDYDVRHVRMVRELGFEAALSTAWGAAHHGCDLFQVPRVAPWDPSAFRYGARLVRAYSQRTYPLAPHGKRMWDAGG